jgi:hypothetical protein
MKKLCIIFSLIASLGGNLFSQTVTVQVDPNSSSGASKTVTLVSQVGGTWGLSNPNGWAWTDSTNQDQVTLSSQTQFISDPTIHYALGVSNDTDTIQTYTFTFSLPLTTALVAGQQVTVSSSVSGSVADGDGNGVVLGLALNTPYIQQAYIGTTDAGVDLLNQPLTFSTTDTMSFGPAPTLPNTTTETVTSPANSIQVVTSFTLTPNDSASLSGKFVVTVVPEPSDNALLLAGLGALMVAVLRRRRIS